MRFEDLKSARVAILGAGREGRAVWRQLRSRFPEKPLSLFAEASIDRTFLDGLDGRVDHWHSGPFDPQVLRQYDVLVRSAGISPYRDDLGLLRSLGCRFTTASSLWFAENPDAKTICISGTKGKSTTAALTFHLLANAGVRACLAGNIGRPMLDCEDDRPDWWVIELSSYQLCDLEASVSIAVLLNMFEEHLDWHGGLQNYQRDKLRLAELCDRGHLVANHADGLLSRKLGEGRDISWFNHPSGWCAGPDGVFKGAATVQHVSPPPSLPGMHNRQNLAAALTAVELTGSGIADVEKTLEGFNGLDHRLQLLGTKDGVSYIDDSISTTPVSVSAALNTVGYERVVLLLGGLDRGLDWSGFADELSGKSPFAIITLPDNGPAIAACLEGAGVRPAGGFHRAKDLRSAVRLAQALAPGGGCILLSPGAPSQPHFRDFEQRGEQFRILSGF